MDGMVRPDALSPATAKPAGTEAGEAARGGKSFDDVMSGVEGGKRPMPQLEIREVPTLPSPQQSRVHKLTAEKTKQAQEPGGIEKLTGDLTRGQERLHSLIEELKTGRTYSPQELLGMQAEMQDITLQIEVTTKVVAEATSGVRNLLQQQA